MELKDNLPALIAYLNNQSTIRLKEHSRAIEEIDQDLHNKGRDRLQESSIRRFIEQCRTFLSLQVEDSWAYLKNGLSDPYPDLTDEAFREIRDALEHVAPSVAEVTSYFDGIDERCGDPRLRKLIDEVNKQISEQRGLLLCVKEVEIKKFLQEVERLESKRQRELPTYYDRLLRWVKNRPILVWIYLLLLIPGVFGGLSYLYQRICGEYAGVQCITEIFAKESQAKSHEILERDKHRHNSVGN